MPITKYERVCRIFKTNVVAKIRMKHTCEGVVVVYGPSKQAAIVSQSFDAAVGVSDGVAADGGRALGVL